MTDTETSGLGNLLRELEKAHRETNIVSVESVEEIFEDVVEEKVLIVEDLDNISLSDDDQNKLEVFSNLLNTINFVEEPEPEPVDDSDKIAAFEKLFEKFLEPTSEPEPIVEVTSVPEIEVTPVLEIEVTPVLEIEVTPVPEVVVEKIPEIYSKAISESGNPYSILTNRTVERTGNIIQDIVSTLDDMGKKTQVKEEIEQIASTQKEFDNFRTFIMQKIAGLQMSGAGSGETRLEFLDDIDRSTAKVNNKYLRYSSSSGKWVGADAASSGNPAADDISSGDAAILLTTSSGDITIDAAANNSDIILKGTDGGVDTTFLTIDGSEAGAATFNSTVTTTGIVIGSTAVTSTAAELNAVDGITAVVGELNALDIGSTAVGTAVASKAVILDSSKDYTGIRNLTISGEIDAATGDFSGAVDVAGATTTAAITASGIIKTDDSTAATSTTDGSLQTDGGLSVVLDAVIGDDIIMISDAAQIAFGVNSDVTLKHVHNVGLTMTHVGTGDNLPMVLQLKSEEDAITVNEVIGSLEFAAGDSDGTDGATVAAGIHAIAEGTFAADANATKLVFTTGVSETAASSATAKATLSSIGDFQVAGDLVVKDDGLIGSASDLDAIAIASNGVVTFSQIPVLPADSIDSNDLKTLSTLLIKNSGGSTLATFHTAGA